MNYMLETGLRGCLRHPRTMTLVVLTLALGLASVMTMLTLLSVLGADPLPGISHTLHLAWADSRETAKSGDSDTYGDGSLVPPLWKLADARAMQQLRPDIRQVALVTAPVTVASIDGRARKQVSAAFALGPMLPVFEVPLRHGRYWTPEEEMARTPVVVISRALSQRLLGREDGTGAEVRLGKRNFRVITGRRRDGRKKDEIMRCVWPRPAEWPPPAAPGRTRRTGPAATTSARRPAGTAAAAAATRSGPSATG
jgi:putative ABC transport system permease protein